MPPSEPENVFAIFHFLRNVFTLVGLSSFRNFIVARHNKVVVFIFDCYGALVDIIIVTANLRFYGKLLLESEEQSSLVEAFVAVVFANQVIIRMIILRMKRKTINSYFAKIDNIEYVGVRFIQLFNDRYKSGRRVVTCLFVSQVLGGLVAFLVVPFIFHMDKGLVPGFYPFKDFHYSVKYIYQAHDFLLALFFMVRSVAMDFFCVTLINFHAIQQEILKKKLKFILQDIKDNCKTYEAEKERIAEWCRYHQESLRNIDHLKEFLEPLLLASYVYSLINVVNAIAFILVEGEMAVYQKILGSGTIFTCFAFLGWFCVVADKIKEQQENLPLQFDLGQASQDPGLKSTFLILSPRCYWKLKISAMGFFTLSSRGFAEVMSASFSALATFWQLRGRVLR